MAKPTEQIARTYKCVRVSAVSKNDITAYRYSFVPHDGSHHMFSSLPEGELAFMALDPTLYTIGQVYPLFATGDTE